MKRRATPRFGLIALLLAAAGSSCSSQDAPAGPSGAIVTDKSHGGLMLGLVPVSGVTLTSIHYVVSTPACVACENAGDCFESVNNCLGVGPAFA